MSPDVQLLPLVVPFAAPFVEPLAWPLVCAGPLSDGGHIIAVASKIK